MATKSKLLSLFIALVISLCSVTEISAAGAGAGAGVGGAAPTITVPAPAVAARNPQAASLKIKSELQRIASEPAGSPGQAEATAVLGDIVAGHYHGSPAMQVITAAEDYNRRIAVRGRGGAGGGGAGGAGGGGAGGGHGGGVPLGVPPYTKPAAMDIGVFTAINTVAPFNALNDPEKQAIVDHIQAVFPGLPANPHPPARRGAMIAAINATGAYAGAVAAPIADAIDWAFPAPLTKPATMDQSFFDTIRHTRGFAALHLSYQQEIVDALHHDFPTLPLPLLPGRTARIIATLHALPPNAHPAGAMVHGGGFMTPALEAAIAASIDARFPAITNSGLVPALYNAIIALPGFSAPGVKQQPLINSLHTVLNPPPPFGPGRDIRVKDAVTRNDGQVPFASAVVNAVNNIGYPRTPWVHQVFAPNSQGADAEAELNHNLAAINAAAGAPGGGFTPLMINEIAYTVESTQGPLVPGGAAVPLGDRKRYIKDVVRRLAGIAPLANSPVLTAVENVCNRVIDYVRPAHLSVNLFNNLKSLENIKILPSRLMANNIFTALDGVINPGPIPAFGPARDLQLRGIIAAVPGVAGIGAIQRTQLQNAIIARFNREYPQMIPVIPMPAAGDGLMVANAILRAIPRLDPAFAHRAGEVVNALPAAATQNQKITAALRILLRGDPILLPMPLPLPVPALAPEEIKDLKAALWFAFIDHLLAPGGIAGAGAAAPAPGVPLNVTNALSGHRVTSGTITAQTANKVGNALHALLAADPTLPKTDQIEIGMTIINDAQPNLMNDAAINPTRGGDGTIPHTIKNLIAGSIPNPPPPVLLTAADLGMDAELYRIITNNQIFINLHADIVTKNALLNTLAALLVPLPIPAAVNAAFLTNIKNAIEAAVPTALPPNVQTLRRELVNELIGISETTTRTELRRDIAVLAAFRNNEARRDAVINHVAPLLANVRAHKHHSAQRDTDITNWVNATPGLAPAPTAAEIRAIINTINRIAP